MAIEITSQPYTTEDPEEDDKQPPVPVSDCLQWCLQPDTADVITTPGVQATVVIELPATPTVPANGTAMTIWGHEFTVDDSTPYTATTFEVTTNAATTLLNLYGMLDSNIFFSENIEPSAALSGVGLTILTITWRECREQSNFGGTAMDFTAIEDAGGTGTPTNGSSPVYTEGYAANVQLLKHTGGVFQAITPVQAIQVKAGCEDVDPFCVDFMSVARRTLFTPMPDLTNSSEIDPATPTMTGRFQLKYGWTYREDCQAKAGTALRSGQVLVINSAFEEDETYGMRRYWYDHPNGYPSGQFVSDFLTNQPKALKLSADSKAWLWLLNNWDDAFPDLDKLLLRFVIYKIGTVGVFSIHTIEYTPCAWYEVMNFNASPGRVFSLEAGVNVTTLDWYEVQVVGIDAANDPLFNASEYLRYALDPQCSADSTDVYFVTPPGGIGTLLVEITDKELEQSGIEICLDTPCTADREEKAKYGGRHMVNQRSFERITIRAIVNHDAQNKSYFRSFKASPQRWIRVTQADGTFMARKFIVEPGGVKIFRVGENIELVATGYTADIPMQAAKMTV